MRLVVPMRSELQALRAILMVFLAASVAGCGVLPGSPFLRRAGTARSQPIAPSVTLPSVRLAAHPRPEHLAAYFCPQFAPALLCNAIFGTVAREQLVFRFDVELEITNRNPFPLPLVQALVAFTAYPGAEEQQVGTVCVSFCEDPQNCRSDPNACRSTEPEIRDLDDFAYAATRFLVSVAMQERRLEDLRVRTVPANQPLRTIVQLELEPDSMLGLIRRAADTALASLQRGQVPQFIIPYAVEGSIWTSVDNFGRLAATFPRVTGEWNLTPEQARLPAPTTRVP